jgi:hypothetical protein
MKNFKLIIFFTLLFLFIPKIGLSQDFRDYLDAKWDNYYNNNPSGIESNFSGSDFIRVIEIVNFTPTNRLYQGDINLLKRVLLALSFASLRQMKIDGDFYSRSKKHYDYYYLYNTLYPKIDKNIWNRYAPYLIGLMSLDGAIKTN